MIKKIICTLLAADFAFGALACGVKKAEERTLETMAAMEEHIERLEETTDPVAERYVKDSLGAFSLTFYVPDERWGYSTATGAKSQHLKTCAVDPSVIPYGSVIQITGNNGQKLTLKAVDCGGGIKGNKIDIFWDGSISAGYKWIAEFGTIHNVYLLEE